MSWIHDVVIAHEEMESPKSFWFWSALATLSAVVKDNVYLNRAGAYKLYPNIFVMLYADSGLKKGPPVALAKDLVKRVNNTRVISGRSSIQGVLKELGTSSTVPGGKITNKSVGFIVASEFTSSLVNDPAAMTILTDLYDRQYNEGEWKSLLKMESFSLKDPTITLLVATNDAHFDSFLQSKDMKGGFIGRVFMIAEHEVQKLNSLIAPLEIEPDKEKMAVYLKQVCNLNGEFHPLGSLSESDEYKYRKDKGKKIEWFNAAGKMYDDWYERFYQDFKDSEAKDETGAVQRFGDSVLKIAMLLSLSDSTSLMISEDNISEAILLGEKLIGNVRKTTYGKLDKNKDPNLDRKNAIIRELLRRIPHVMTRSQLNAKYWTLGNSDEWDRCMLSLEDGKFLTISSEGNQIVYRMTDAAALKLANYLKGTSNRS